MYALIKCLGHAFLKHGAKAVANLVPFGGAAYDIAAETWQLYSDQGKSQTLPGELQAVVQASAEQFGQAAAKVLAEVAANRSTEERRHLTLFLEQVPRSVRQSFRRSSDPSGRTVPGGLRIDKPADLLPLLPARLPRFREGQSVPGTDLLLLELLGMGGFGEVWKAGNKYYSALAPVAIKFCLDPAAKDRLLHHEAGVLVRVMAQGRLPGVVQLLHTHLDADPPFLEYEYVEGGDLAGFIGEYKRAGGIDAITATKIVRKLAKTVGFMHRLKPPIVHRDLKPANVLVQRDNENRVHFKITDFGIGAVAADRELAEHTRRPTSFGEGLTTGLRGAFTPLYASPQQQAGSPPDPRDDVHALGVIWYQLLTADLALMAIPPDWREVAADHGLSPEGIHLLGACLASRPDTRPADAGVLAERAAKLITSGDTDEVAKDMDKVLAQWQTKGGTRLYFAQQGPVRIAVWRQTAEKGDARAQWLLARCLQEGAGVEADQQAAVSWLRRAAESGQSSAYVAQTSLGDCYYDGLGVEPNAVEAFRLYTKAASQGFLEAETSLAVCYYDGQGVEKDLVKAARHYRKASEGGWARAQDGLGDCYFEGEGVEQDYPQAISWYRKAAEQGLASRLHSRSTRGTRLISRSATAPTATSQATARGSTRPSLQPPPDRQAAPSPARRA